MFRHAAHVRLPASFASPDHALMSSFGGSIVGLCTAIGVAPDVEKLHGATRHPQRHGVRRAGEQD
jgi:hypothetical protein